MAKKIPKARQGVRSMRVLFIELLLPWLVMGAAALILVSQGVTGVTAFAIAIGAALLVTLYIGAHERRRIVHITKLPPGKK